MGPSTLDQGRQWAAEAVVDALRTHNLELVQIDRQITGRIPYREPNGSEETRPITGTRLGRVWSYRLPQQYGPREFRGEQLGPAILEGTWFLYGRPEIPVRFRR